MLFFPIRPRKTLALMFGLAMTAFGQTSADHSRQAQTYLRDKRPDLAIREYEAILKSDPNNVEAHGNLGVLLFFQGQYGRATSEMRTALSQNPNLPRLQVLLGMSEKRSGEAAKAKTDLERTFPGIEDRNLKVQAGLELMELYHASNELDKAAAIAVTLRQLQPENPEVMYAAYRIYSELCNETMLSLVLAAPSDARTHQVMAHELSRQGDIEKAIVHYRQALQASPRNADLHYEMAELLNTLSAPDKKEEAEKEYLAALELNPMDSHSASRLGEIAMKRSDMANAVKFFERALKSDPNDTSANLGMARAMTIANQPEKARQYLERAVQLEPYDPMPHYRLAAAYRSLGRSDDAKRELGEFEKLKKMRSHLEKVYEEMKLRPSVGGAGDETP